jgi:hypothetical protein
MWRETTTEDLNAGIDDPTIDTNNGWQKVEAVKGKMPRFLMSQSTMTLEATRWWYIPPRA